MLCLSFVLASIVTDPLTAWAQPTPGKANDPETIAYINQCQYSIKDLGSITPKVKQIGCAYLVGTDDIAAPSWSETKRVLHDIYAVEPGTEIGGHVYDKYYPQNNLEYLKDISRNYGVFASSGRINQMSKGAQYVELEGANLAVVACDEKWVTIYDRGYQSWDAYYAAQGIATGGTCQHAPDDFLMTHPAGFYKIERSKVWLDLDEVAYDTHPYSSKEKIPDKGTGAVTHLAKLRPYPNENEKTDWKSTPVYALPKNTKVTVVSTELVPSETPGSTSTYYKVSFNGSDKVQNNAVLYLTYTVPGVYYIDSRYLNFTEKGKTLPKGNTLGEITNVASGKYIYAYESKDTNSNKLAYLENGAELEMYPSESDADWTTVYFSGQKCYVQTKYIKKGKYSVKDIGNPYLADIVKNQLVIKWNKGEGNVDFSCVIKDVKDKVLWSDAHVKKNQLTVKSEILQKAQKVSMNASVKITVQANDRNGDKGKAFTYYFSFGTTTGIMNTGNMEVKRTSLNMKYTKLPNGDKMYYGSLGESLQISTDKNFKNARIVEKPYKEKGKTRYRLIYEIKNLKPNTTYYLRRRHTETIKTKAGDRQLTGPWSKAIKIKTKK